MYIERLKLLNFRNYSDLNIQFSPGINFITGLNGSGKTNILESISVLSNLKSFKLTVDNDLIKWGNNSYYCSGEIVHADYKKFEVGFIFDKNNKKKRFKINSNEIKKASQYYGKLLSVFLLPEDINIIAGTPEIKRRYFDSVISKVYPEYIHDLNDFKMILFSRNKVLKQIKESTLDNKSLEVWDRLFSEKYSKIYLARKKFLFEFNSVFRSVYDAISDDGLNPGIDYTSSIDACDKDTVYESLISNHRADIFRGLSSIGPQKDLDSFVGGERIYLKKFASQGQKRTTAIALKLAEFDFIDKTLNKNSIILVDDIFSELDNLRRNNMMSYLKAKGQLIFTMVNKDILDLKDISDYKLFKVDSNRVYEG